jgi:hypothetical protein
MIFLIGAMPQDNSQQGLNNGKNWDSRRGFYGHEAQARRMIIKNRFF